MTISFKRGNGEGMHLDQVYQNICSNSDLQKAEVPENTRMDNQTEWEVGNGY
jgi:hypothetical protein